MFEDLYGILTVAAVIAAFFLFFFVKRKEGKDWVYVVYFIVTLFAGTVLYSLALVHDNDADTAFSPVFLVLQSLSYSLSSFGGNFNASVVAKSAKENHFFQAAVIVHFFASMFLTSLVVVKLFGKNVINAIRVYLISRGGKFIVIGCEGQAEIFLGNLDSRQKRHTTVILQPNQADKKRELMDSGYAVVTVKQGETNNEDIFISLHNALKRAGAMRCKYETRVISMSGQDEINLLTARILTDYITGLINLERVNGRITLTGGQEEAITKVRLDARIMYSFLERAEHFAFIENALRKVRFFNLHEIRARKFLWENPVTQLIPPHWIDTKKAKLKTSGEDGKKAYKIGNIFVGFGSANRAIFKTSIINNQLLNVDYNALVITKDAKKHEMRFRNNASGLFDETENGKIIRRGAEIKPNPKGKVYLESPLERNNIVFREADALSVELYDLVIREIDGRGVQDNRNPVRQCDYATVIIALGDNRLSIETAMELRQKLYEADLLFGKDGNIEYQRVRLFVKIDENTILADEKILNNDDNGINCRIEIFGADEEVLTEEYIINEKLDTLAKNIANRYEGNTETATAANEWNTCTQLQRESCRYAAMAVRVKLNLLGLDFSERSFRKDDNPDPDDLFHSRYGTNTAFNLRAERRRLEGMLKLARDDETGGKGIQDIILSLDVSDEIIDLAERSKGDFADTPRNNLAKLEHQRWNSFYLANDWTKLPKEKIGVGRAGRQDGPAKQHACITTFNGLMELREIQKNAEKAEIVKKKEKQYIEAESLLKADTIRHDFNTMDFLLDLTNENLLKLMEADENPGKKYTGILTGSGFHICEFLLDMRMQTE